MFNLRWGIFAGIIAFVLAFATSLLLGQTGLPVAALRALIFAVVFFGLGIGAWVLINTFIPELLFSDSDSSGSAAHDVFGSISSESLDSEEEPRPYQGSAGSRVNITVDDYASPALPEDDDGMASKDDVGNFSDLVSGTLKPAAKTNADSSKDIDQTPASSYTTETEQFAPELNDTKDHEQGEFSVDFGAFVSEGNGMGELDQYMDSFSLFSSDEGSSELMDETAPSAPPERKMAANNKPADFKGDFNPKEIAAGIRTVLEQDKKG